MQYHYCHKKANNNGLNFGCLKVIHPHNLNGQILALSLILQHNTDDIVMLREQRQVRLVDIILHHVDTQRNGH